MSSDLRQRSVRHPLLFPAGANAEPLGVVGLRCRALMFIDRGRILEPLGVRFVVDSGASFTTAPLELAEGWLVRLPPPGADVELRLLTAAGGAPVRVRPGRIRLWWEEDCSGYAFDWPILFTVDAPPTVPPILGLGGPLMTCRWTFDGTYATDAPYGSLVLDDTR